MLPRGIVKAQTGRFDCLLCVSMVSAEVFNRQRDNLNNLKAGTSIQGEM